MTKVFEVRNLAFTYGKNGVKALRGIDFDVNKGEIFGLLGPSGAGKSTTQKLLIKLLENYEGNIVYNNKDLKTHGNDFYEDVGVGFELPVHFSKLTANENMKFFSRLYKETTDSDQLLSDVGLLESKDQLVGEFSKGMKMRLNFVRAMLNAPSILFLDEPTNGLDPKNARMIKEQIRAFKNRGGTVILSTHLMNDVEELCDRVAFISEGVIKEISTVRELKKRYGKRELFVEYSKEGTLQTETFDLDTIGDNETFKTLLKTSRIETMHTGETSLDEIFIKVTGDALNT